MKSLLLSICLAAGTCLVLQAQTDYMQWEAHLFTPKRGQEKMFEKALGAHNKKYHNAEPYKTWIYEVQSGPNTGNYYLFIGPMTFTQMEARPSNDEHNEDWDKVMTYVESVSPTDYWRSQEDINYWPENTPVLEKSRLRFFTILPGQNDRFESMIRDFAQVYKDKKYKAGYSMYTKYGASQGPHAITEISFPNWSFLDGENTMEKDFEEVHGEGSYDRFIEEIALCVDRSKTYDELISFRLDLSSDMK